MMQIASQTAASSHIPVPRTNAHHRPRHNNMPSTTGHHVHGHSHGQAPHGLPYGERDMSFPGHHHHHHRAPSSGGGAKNILRAVAATRALPRGGGGSSGVSSTCSSNSGSLNSNSNNSGNNKKNVSINLAKSGKFSHWWFASLPEVVRFCLAGSIGTAIFWVVDKWIFWEVLPSKYVSPFFPTFLQGSEETVSFFVAYLIQIMAQHILNAIIVFGWHTIATREKYLSTLVGCYSAYFSTLTGGTIFNAMLIRTGFAKTTAFWATISASSVVNFFLVKWVVQQKNKQNLGAATTTTRGGGGGGGGARVLPKRKSSSIDIVFNKKHHDDNDDDYDGHNNNFMDDDYIYYDNDELLQSRQQQQQQQQQYHQHHQSFAVPRGQHAATHRAAATTTTSMSLTNESNTVDTTKVVGDIF